MHNDIKMQYSPGIFSKFRSDANYEQWDNFPEVMWGLGYEMDFGNSFEEYRAHCKVEIKPAKSKREERRNTLYLLEHANRQIVGNFLFSEWRYYTHWAFPEECDSYLADYFWRIIDILESKYTE